MKEEIIIAGFGGQGILSMGKILAYSALMQNREVTWMPSYGPEMRGGTANVTVVISDNRISSPIINQCDSAVLLNQQSIDKFESHIKPGGILLYDPIGVTRPPKRKDIKVYYVEATKTANDMGKSVIFNMIVMGALLKIKPVVEMEFVRKGLEKSLPARHHHLIPLNEEAIKKGMEILMVLK